jgi:hypothetical protein
MSFSLSIKEYASKEIEFNNNNFTQAKALKKSA